MYDGYSLFAVLKRTEIKHIKAALKKHGGVKSKAAKELGIKRTTLIEKLRRLDLTGFANDVSSKKTLACKSGHPLVDPYIYTRNDRNGQIRRVCKECARIRYLERRAKRTSRAADLNTVSVPTTGTDIKSVETPARRGFF